MAQTKIKRLSKKQLLRIRRRMLVSEMALIVIAIVLVFFNFALSLTGGWDDINHVALLIAPSFALGALAIAMLDVLRYKAKHERVVLPLITIGISAIFYMVISFIEVTMLTR